MVFFLLCFPPKTINLGTKNGANVFFSCRRSFIQLASSPEAFLMLRSHFARTYGCMCICQYVLGIGDRHLSNMMVDLEYGGVIGIDFGHAFGSATQVNTNFPYLPTYLPSSVPLFLSPALACTQPLTDSPTYLLTYLSTMLSTYRPTHLSIYVPKLQLVLTVFNKQYL